MSVTNEETGRLVRKIWWSSLDEIGNLDLQRRTWLDPNNKNPHWSFVEFVCSYPDTDELEAGQKKGWLSPAEATILIEFGKTLAAHKSPAGNDYDNAAILDDPAWHDVVRSAQQALQKLTKLPRHR
ncbi:hypothetical protein ACVILK_004874 [Bradyrhizobium embrapense]